ncbi:HNH endonuclease signature motif containing protein, partial [Geodermatophilus normandii]
RELLDWLAVRHRVTTPAQLGDRVRPRNGDLDHVHRWSDGPTAAANLAGLCTTDHRGKHRAPGWTHDLQPDDTLTVTTPSGLTAITEPPPY